MIQIRAEEAKDYARVEKVTRRAFYNIYMPGCTEHYMIRTMRSHPDFIPELALVTELDGEVIGNIMYTKAKLVDEAGQEKEILTFGPISVLPEYQRRGYGKRMIERSFRIAAEMGYDVVVIFGSPANYVARGFRSCKKANVCVGDGVFPSAMLVKELRPGALDGRRWSYHGSPATEISDDEAIAYDDTLEPMERKWLPSQEEFYIMSHSQVG